MSVISFVLGWLQHYQSFCYLSSYSVKKHRYKHHHLWDRIMAQVERYASECRGEELQKLHSALQEISRVNEKYTCSNINWEILNRWQAAMCIFHFYHRIWYSTEVKKKKQAAHFAEIVASHVDDEEKELSGQSSSDCEVIPAVARPEKSPQRQSPQVQPGTSLPCDSMGNGCTGAGVWNGGPGAGVGMEGLEMAMLCTVQSQLNLTSVNQYFR